MHPLRREVAAPLPAGLVVPQGESFKMIPDHSSHSASFKQVAVQHNHQPKVERTDEGWENQAHHRQKLIERYKQRPDYMKSLQIGLRGRTPDPTERISKRAFRKKLIDWREERVALFGQEASAQSPTEQASLCLPLRHPLALAQFNAVNVPSKIEDDCRTWNSFGD